MATEPQAAEAVRQNIIHVALLVADYDDAIRFYTQALGFDLIEDSFQPEQNKRWVVVAPANSSGTALLLAKAVGEQQTTFVGNQAGGRVFLFLATDNLDRDHQRLLAHQVTIVREPVQQPYGKVLVFADLYGNLWDLIERTPQ